MNIILLEPNEIQVNSVRLEDERAKHIVKVLRSVPGDRIRVGVINGNMGYGEVLDIKKKYPFQVQLRVECDHPPKTGARIDLILALPRPIMLKRILSQVTALGVGSIHLINANRVEKSFWEAGILDEREYRTHLLHGLEQAVDTIVPTITVHKRFKIFVEDYLPGYLDKYNVRICAHPEGNKKLADVVDSSSRVILAIGPEGGWVEYELEKFKVLDFSCCSVGERILKVDTAAVALHSRISALQEILGVGIGV